MSRLSIPRYLVLFGAVIAAAGNLSADITGAISGIVTDPTGGAVAGAQITLRNANTGLKRETKSGANGYYEFLAVPVGDNYSVEAEAQGFQKSVVSHLRLLVNQRYRADFSLTVGTLTQEVTINATEAQVETISTQLGDVIQDRKMTSLPLNGRSYIDLLGLQAGVVPITSSVAFTDRPVSGTLAAGGVAVNGNRETANSFLVNGGSVEESKNNGASIIPSLDSIQEFRVLTNSFDAEYGRFSGAMVNVVTKSGTNQLHGSAYEFLRNEKLDARNFFDANRTDPSTGQQIPNSARGVFKRNQFGFTLGGPIIKNRLFFFSDYQGTREVRGLTTGAVTVPTEAERSGIFSSVAGAGFPSMTSVVRGDNVPGNHTFDEILSARLGYTVNAGEPYWKPGCDSASAALAGVCVFPNQVIPASAWSPVSKATVKFIPAPTGFRGGTPFFSTSSEKRRVNDDKTGHRVNLNTQKTGDWAIYYHYDTAGLYNPFAGGNVPGFPGNVPTRAQQVNVSNTKSFGATMVNEARLNYTRLFINQTEPAGGPGIGKIGSFGFKTDGLGLIGAVPELEGLPTLNISGSYGFTMGSVPNTIKQINNNYSASESLAKIVGAHSLKFGGEVHKIQVNEYNASTPNGRFVFDGTETGNAFADFLLGAPSAFTQQSYSTFFTRSNYGALFAQDSFKVKPNFTLNLGLRWEVSQPFYETQDRLNVIIWGMQSTKYPTSPIGWVFPGDPGIPRTISPTKFNQFAPRIGLAYSPNATDGLARKLFGGPGKTSIRVAGGIYHTAMEDMPAFYTIGDAPFGLYYESPTEVYLEEPYKDRRRGNDPGQHFPFSDPLPGQPIDWSTYLPIGGSPGTRTDNTLPHVIHMNVNIQREFPGSVVATVGYVGTRGRHLLAKVESNPGNAARCMQINSVLAAQGRAGEGCGPGGENQIYDLNGDGKRTIGIDAFGTRPYSITSGAFAEARGILDFTSNPYNTTWANSNYDALQLSLEKRVGAIRLLGAYTWSKSIDNSSNWNDEQINPFNHRISRSLSAFDMTHNLVVSYTYELPFNRVTHSTVSRTILGGWQLSGISRFTTGLPITLTASGDRSLVGSGGIDRPNYSGAAITILDPRASSTHLFFDKSPFSQEALGVAGNANRRFFHGPGLNNFDISFVKATKVKERISTELRIEFFNVFNHAQFTNPTGNFTSSSFGRVTSARDPRIGQAALKVSF
jgi:hypothetical protein